MTHTTETTPNAEQVAAPAWILALPEEPAWQRQLKHRLLDAYQRLSAQTLANEELEREQRAALAWCRENGNPHLRRQS